MITKVKYSEEQLVEMLKESNRQAFSVLYDNYSRALLGVIRKNIADEEISEDVLQDAFIKIWNNRLMYDASKGRLYTWMLNIARNTSIDYLRSKQNKMDEKIQRNDNNVHESNLSNNVETNIDGIGIKAIVGSLKDEQKILIDLAYYKGYTQDEIAQRLNIPLGTVKTRMRAAIMVLRKLI
ncbi:MAG: sigma-70 family polymerase sigma factor [Bacteroidota bacterium]|jgi:RNA polymerase sigma-70 factor (ECF subfamily)|nr:sigma-70 family polymerase sigma factor [Bacteroidota bacterium]